MASISRMPRRYAGRAFEIAEQIRTGSRVTADDLAQKFNVSKRTIYRDLDLLRKSGISVQFDNLADSYCIVGEQSLAGSGELQIRRRCNINHLRDLILATRCSPWMHIDGIQETLDTIFSMFMDKLDLPQRQAMERLYQACTFETHQPRHSTLERDLLRALAKSIMDQVTLEILVVDDLISKNSDIHLDNWEDYAVWLQFEVKEIYAHESSWFVSGFCHEHQGNRCYALQNIMNVSFSESQNPANALNLDSPSRHGQSMN